MAVRLRYKTEVVVSSTDAEEKDLGNPKAEVVSDTLTEGGTFKVTVPAGAVNQAVGLHGIAVASFLAVRTVATDPNTTPVSLFLRRNLTTAEQIEIAPLQGTVEGVFMLSSAGITALYVSNPGAVSMNFIYSVGGD